MVRPPESAHAHAAHRLGTHVALDTGTAGGWNAMLGNFEGH